jgi:arabinose-5-phosphate isomerase
MELLPKQVGNGNAWKLFRDVMCAEATEIQRAVDRLNPDSIEKVVRLICDCQGKVVLMGVGKSGLIAQKIAATMMSTGTTAMSLHASDAVHGDIGIFGSSDIAIMLSNSGETEELLALLPHINRRKISIIAIVGKTNSTLARHADVIIDAGVSREACPLNLAPTASTSVALAIGDALAMAIAQCKGFTENDFALNHPAGWLGKRLTLRVMDLMHGEDSNPRIRPDALWQEIVIALTGFRLGAVNVLDGGGKLLGLVTDGDLRRAMQLFPPNELAGITASKIMTRNPIVIPPEMLAYDAMQIMNQGKLGLSVLPVVNEQGIAIGMLRIQDLSRAGI